MFKVTGNTEAFAGEGMLRHFKSFMLSDDICIFVILELLMILSNGSVREVANESHERRDDFLYPKLNRGSTTINSYLLHRGN